MLYVVQMDGDVMVSVMATLFVVEAKPVKNLMHDSALPFTAVPDGHLNLLVAVADRGVAPETTHMKMVRYTEQEKLSGCT